jgi:3-hydroxyacyl-CoA dehydrogenase/enoyl-CoA hydratase/3-hydroxybutyryl-CoA epimerase
MLTGRSVSAVEARTIGLVDKITAGDRLDDAAAEILRKRPPLRKPAWYLRLLNLSPIRPFVARSVRAQLRRKASPDQYPAPFAMIDLWQRHGASGAAAYSAEAKSIGELMTGATSKNLVRVFFLRERLKKLASKDEKLRRVHVVGAGVMGGDIASWCALRGLDVTLQDREQKFVEPALARARKLFAKRLRGPGDAAAAEARLRVDLQAECVGDADIVIEAIIEDVDAKRALFSELETKVSETALLATNTSSITLEAITERTAVPHRYVGLHFFNPVSRLPLVEVVRGEQTDDETLSKAMSFAVQIGKLPLPCRSAPGFVVNRILAPYMLEALRAHEEGIALEVIDKAAEAFGMPTGPIELADRVGLDIALHVTELLGSEAPAALRTRIEAGDLGAKTGKGFYEFENNRPKKKPVHDAPDEDLTDRLILALVNEAMACYEDGVVEDLDLLDAGVIFGTGFAPFRGGPIHYARQRGIETVVERLDDLAERFGTQFTPRPGWRKLAAAK